MTFSFVGTFGHLTDGIVGRSSKGPLQPEALSGKWEVNYGLSQACNGSLTLSSACMSDDRPEIVVWGDSFAMHLVPGILASKPKARIVQFTKNSCVPCFDIAPISRPGRPVRWAESCLEFTNQVRKWLKGMRAVKEYAVLSSPFSHYFDGDALLRNGERVVSNTDLAVGDFEKTLRELKNMGITPVVFSPPPSNGRNIGHCLARTMWFEEELDKCNFQVGAMNGERLAFYAFLETIEREHPVVCRDRLICGNSVCQTHFGSVFVYRDDSHLSIEGSAELGRKAHFYNMIISSAYK